MHKEKHKISVASKLLVQDCSKRAKKEGKKRLPPVVFGDAVEFQLVLKLAPKMHVVQMKQANQLPSCKASQYTVNMASKCRDLTKTWERNFKKKNSGNLHSDSS